MHLNPILLLTHLKEKAAYTLHSVCSHVDVTSYFRKEVVAMMNIHKIKELECEVDVCFQWLFLVVGGKLQ